jgi:hypothetical protein
MRRRSLPQQITLTVGNIRLDRGGEPWRFGSVVELTTGSASLGPYS